MAIYSASIRAISRADGRSATAAAAYRSGTVIRDDRYGMTFDYTRKGRGVMGSFIVLPSGAPEALLERSVLWNAAEASEKRKDARVARELILALPHELDEGVRADTARSVAEMLVQRLGVAVDVSLHKPDRGGDRRNWHAHLLFTVREVGEGGFGAKTKVLDDFKTGPAEVQAIRQAIAEIINDDLAEAGLDVRVSHLSHAARGIDLPPQIHEGQAATQMRRRGAKMRESENVIDFRGREVRYTEIDQGGTRAEYNAEIINLQKYRDVQQEQEDQAQEENLEDQIEALQERAGEIVENMAGLQAALNSAHLTNSMRGRIKAMLDKVLATLFYRKEYERERDATSWKHHVQQQQIEFQKKTRELAEKKKEHQAIQQKVDKLRRKQEEARVVIAANSALNSKIILMPARLNGHTPYVFRVSIPIIAVFNVMAYPAALKQKPSAELLQRVLQPLVGASGTNQASVTLRQDVLQVKELLSRIDLEKIEGIQCLRISSKTARLLL